VHLHRRRTPLPGRHLLPGPVPAPGPLRPAVTIACGVSGRATSVTPVSARLHNSLTYFTLSLGRGGEREDLERGCSRARLNLNAPVPFCPSLFRRLVEGPYLSDALILLLFALVAVMTCLSLHLTPIARVENDSYRLIICMYQTTCAHGVSGLFIYPSFL
jgi:hypothetical protein